MTQNQLNKFRGTLEMSASALAGSARRRDAILIEGVADEFERMHRAVDREIAVRSLESGSAKLREVRAALQRIEDGTYGICLECDGPISPKRLAAVPWTTLCIRCREASDCSCGVKHVPQVLAQAA